jgi:hypothetical protein
LRRIDRAIRQLWRVAGRVPEHRYDLYILADHGQTPCKPYREVNHGQRFERWVFNQYLNSTAVPAADKRPDFGLGHGMRATSQDARGLFQHYLNYINADFMRREDPEACEENGVRVIAAGPNAFLYVLDSAVPLDDEAVDKRFPGLAEKLSNSAGVGFVLARSRNGPVCFWRGRRFQLCKSGAGPFANRPDVSLVSQGIIDLMNMPSAGDLVIYGIDAAVGHVSFIPERGGHGGPSREEMQTFIVSPQNVTLPSPIRHPTELYNHFIHYQEPS